MTLCDKCRERPLSLNMEYLYFTCVKCGVRIYDEAIKWNVLPRVVWLRSNRVSYSTELRNGVLWPNGEIIGRPELAEFKWEKWP